MIRRLLGASDITSLQNRYLVLSDGTAPMRLSSVAVQGDACREPSRHCSVHQVSHSLTLFLTSSLTLSLTLSPLPHLLLSPSLSPCSWRNPWIVKSGTMDPNGQDVPGTPDTALVKIRSHPGPQQSLKEIFPGLIPWNGTAKLALSKVIASRSIAQTRTMVESPCAAIPPCGWFAARTIQMARQ